MADSLEEWSEINKSWRLFTIYNFFNFKHIILFVFRMQLEEMVIPMQRRWDFCEIFWDDKLCSFLNIDNCVYDTCVMLILHSKTTQNNKVFV